MIKAILWLRLWATTSLQNSFEGINKAPLCSSFSKYTFYPLPPLWCWQLEHPDVLTCFEIPVTRGNDSYCFIWAESTAYPNSALFTCSFPKLNCVPLPPVCLRSRQTNTLHIMHAHFSTAVYTMSLICIFIHSTYYGILYIYAVWCWKIASPGLVAPPRFHCFTVIHCINLV